MTYIKMEVLKEEEHNQINKGEEETDISWEHTVWKYVSLWKAQQFHPQLNVQMDYKI
jgi:hypothetical protein